MRRAFPPCLPASQHGRAILPDVSITDSSEAILLGRKPPFRLLVRAAWHAPGSSGGGAGAGAPSGGGAGSRVGPRGVVIRHAISEGFVVATRRTRTAGKVDIPSVDDPISKLEHMGKETVKKLADIGYAAAAAGVEIAIPENCITKVCARASEVLADWSRAGSRQRGGVPGGGQGCRRWARRPWVRCRCPRRARQAPRSGLREDREAPFPISPHLVVPTPVSSVAPSQRLNPELNSASQTQRFH